MFEFYLKGGLLMHPILFFSVVALTITFERLWYFARLGGRDVHEKFEQIQQALMNGHQKKAKQVANTISGPLGMILKQGLSEAQHEIAAEQMAISGEKITKEAAKGLSLMALIPSLATLLGLLGTVIGLVLAFKKVAFIEGNVSPTLLASGIWVALITTAAGLIVAVPTLIAHHFFQNGVSKLQFEIEHYGSRLLLLLKDLSPETTLAEETSENPSRIVRSRPQTLDMLLSKGEP